MASATAKAVAKYTEMTFKAPPTPKEPSQYAVPKQNYLNAAKQNMTSPPSPKAQTTNVPKPKSTMIGALQIEPILDINNIGSITRRNWQGPLLPPGFQLTGPPPVKTNSSTASS
jgi:hypothetical protein